MMSLWVGYLTGAGLALAYKYCRYIVVSRQSGINVRTATLEWLFEPSRDNGVSWVTTVAVVWVLGYMYIGDVLDMLNWLPTHPSIAFLLGSCTEMIAPTAAKWFINKLMKPFGADG
jgi:hypothetical protein